MTDRWIVFSLVVFLFYLSGLRFIVVMFYPERSSAEIVEILTSLATFIVGGVFGWISKNE